MINSLSSTNKDQTSSVASFSKDSEHESQLQAASQRINTLGYVETLRRGIKNGAVFGACYSSLILPFSLGAYRTYKIASGDFGFRENIPCNAVRAANRPTLSQQLLFAEIVIVSTGTILGSLGGVITGHYHYFKALSLKSE